MSPGDLIEYGEVMRVLSYSDGRQFLEVRGRETGALYCSARDRHDRTWREGDTVAIRKAGSRTEVEGRSVQLSFVPPDGDAFDPDHVPF